MVLGQTPVQTDKPGPEGQQIFALSDLLSWQVAEKIHPLFKKTSVLLVAAFS